jgi:hypothetical protein
LPSISPARASSGRVRIGGVDLAAPAVQPLPEGDVVLHGRTHDIALSSTGDSAELPEIGLPRARIGPNLTVRHPPCA